MKQAGRAAGATVNDVAIGVIAGALRRYLAGRGAYLRRLTAVVPVSLGPASGPLDPRLGNHLGLVFVRVPSTSRMPRDGSPQSKPRWTTRSMLCARALCLAHRAGCDDGAPPVPAGWAVTAEGSDERRVSDRDQAPTNKQQRLLTTAPEQVTEGCLTEPLTQSIENQ